MGAASRSAWAALALAGLLLAVAQPRADAAAVACAHPAERAAVNGHTRAVSCAGGAALRGPARLLYGEPLDPNVADAASLEVLPGLGPSRAAAIVAGRGREPFARVEDLARVPGIGPGILARVAPYLRIEPPRP